MSLLDTLFGRQAQAPGAMQQQPTGLGRILAPEVALPMAAGLLGNGSNAQNFAQGLAFASPGLAEQKQLQAQTADDNKTWAWLQQNAPEYGALQQSGMKAGEALGLYAKQRYGQPDGTDDMREYDMAKRQGFTGSFMDYMTSMKQAGAQNITIGGGKYGTIPQGYMLDESDPAGARLVAIPGGPEDTSKSDTLKQGQADVATRVVTSAASRAREAAKNRQFGGYGQGAAAMMPWTDSAEVARQVEVLKSTAKVENLTAMRQASPTGGALGSVTEKEADMLAAKSGALDPSSPTFERDLDDYELTLLQVVHGPQEGRRIFEASRGGGGYTPSGGTDYKSKYGLD